MKAPRGIKENKKEKEPQNNEHTESRSVEKESKKCTDKEKQVQYLSNKTKNNQEDDKPKMLNEDKRNQSESEIRRQKSCI